MFTAGQLAAPTTRGSWPRCTVGGYEEVLSRPHGEGVPSRAETRGARGARTGRHVTTTMTAETKQEIVGDRFRQSDLTHHVVGSVAEDPILTVHVNGPFGGDDEHAAFLTDLHTPGGPDPVSVVRGPPPASWGPTAIWGASSPGTSTTPAGSARVIHGPRAWPRPRSCGTTSFRPTGPRASARISTGAGAGPTSIPTSRAWASTVPDPMRSAARQ